VPDKDNSVGIVMLMYNRADVTLASLRSLIQAQTLASWEIFLLDNGSEPSESAAVRTQFEQWVRDGRIRGRFVRSGVNHGFPRGNNIGIRFFMRRDDISHICLLNNDVVVTDCWLDRLLEKQADAIGPVTNACGNEQTVPVPQYYPPAADVFPIANQWAQERYSVFRDYVKETDFLGFFCFLARIELFLQVGFLDERFGRGAYEDDDYCIRILARGYRMLIAREVFVYHWGTCSFLQIPLPKLERHLRKNRKMFERKYGRKWNDRLLLPVAGAWDDMVYMAGQSGQLHEQYAKLFASRSMDYLRHLLNGDGQPQRRGRFFRAIQSRCARVGKWWKTTRVGKVLQLLGVLIRKRPVLVLSRWYPSAQDLNDGYFQRVFLIDKVLEEHCRIYVRYEGAETIAGFWPRLSKKTFPAYEFVFRPRNPLHCLVAALLALTCGRIYVHSVLRFSDPLTRWLYRLSRVRIFDVHGVVPEEFQYHEDSAHAQEFGDFERWAFHRSSLIVVVTHAMAEHLSVKYVADKAPAYVCLTNLPPVQRCEIESNGHPRNGIIYCGGLHKWQQMPKMLEYVRREAGRQRFTFLVPHPAEVHRLYGQICPDAFPGTVTCVARHQVPAWYRQHAFGLALREKTVVNAVACPTKLVEYLQYGIVPIVDSPEIGDFLRHGYRYVELGQSLPDAAACAAMAQANRKVLRKLYYEFVCGVEQLRGVLWPGTR
jgi:GT2 family glycosyltransferase